MIYDVITEELNAYLGDTYVLKYANNHDFKWDDILPSVQDEMKFGVLRVDSGSTTQAGGQTIRVEQLRLIVAIPEETKVFKEAVNNLKTMLSGLNTDTLQDTETNVTAQLYFGDYHDASCQIINGSRWWISEVTFIATYYDGVYDSSSVSVEIGTTKTGTSDMKVLKGVMSVNYLNNRTFDSFVFANSNQQKNQCNAIQHQITFNVLYIKNDTLYTSLLNDEDTIKKYIIDYNNGLKTRSLTNMVLASLNENVVIGDVVKATFTFVTGV